jgi:hypothetical protein
MKKFASSILAIAFTIASFAVNAENVERIFSLEGTKISIKAIENSKTVVVSLTNSASGEMTVSLEDAFGANFVSDKVKSKMHFAKRYNLSQLEAGKYRLVVVKNSVKTIQPFELTNRAIVLNELERKDKFLPSVSQKDKKMDVNVLLGNYSNIIVTMFNNEGQKVFEDKNYVILTLNKRYDLSKVMAGTYIVEVVAGDETQYFTVVLDK